MRIALAALAAAVALAAAPAAAAASVQDDQAGEERGPISAGPRVVMAFLPARPPLAEQLVDRFAARGLAVGLTSPSFGGYSPEQTVLHMSQGARLSGRAYERAVGRLDLDVTGRGGRIDGWSEARARARRAAATVVPGLLADAVEEAGGDVAYAGSIGAGEEAAAVAAGRDGTVGRVSVATAATLAERTVDLKRRHELVVTRLPDGRAGLAALDRLLAGARAEDLLYVVHAPPRDADLLPTALSGEGLEGLLTSPTTRRPGLVATADLAPTVLRHLGIRPPAPVQGQRIEAETGTAGDVRGLSDRLAVIIPRREAAIVWLPVGWSLLSLALVLTRGRPGGRAALRIGLLAALWAPGIALLTAALRPAEPVELAVIVAGALALATVTDRRVPWPAAPAVPATAVLLAHAADLFAGSPLIATSLAGPNPIGGVRFYGVGNELETLLSAAVLVGTGAALAYLPRLPARWAPRAFGIACLVVAVIVGAGRLGAAVGGVITLGAGGATAVLCSLPVRPGRGALTLGVLVPVMAVGMLAAIDLATAGGSHFSREMLRSAPGDVLEAALARLELSFENFVAGPRIIAVAVAAALLAAGFRARRMLLAPLDRVGPVAARAFRAGLAGALVATVVGAVANDSGPVVFLIGTTMLLLAGAYVRGRPPRAAQARRPAVSGGTPVAERRPGAV